VSLDITGMVTPSTSLISSAHNREQVVSDNLVLDESNGWITWASHAPGQEGSSSLCWLPIDLRGDVSACREGVFVVFSTSTHQLTVIGFTPMLTSLYEKGLIFQRHLR
jgi:hypothetical protein